MAQRLKRFDRMVNKLTRFPSMRLAQMEDIAGCRTVLPNQGEVDAVAKRIHAKWVLHAINDWTRDGGGIRPENAPTARLRSPPESSERRLSARGGIWMYALSTRCLASARAVLALGDHRVDAAPPEAKPREAAVVIFALSDFGLAVIVAGATALGAGLGGAITGFVTLRAERDRERFARDQEAERRYRELQTAVRLVIEELDDGAAKVGIAHADGHYWLHPQHSLSAAQWHEHRRVLAAELDEAPWSAAAMAYQWFNRLNRAVLEGESEISGRLQRGQRIEVGYFDDLESARESATTLCVPRAWRACRARRRRSSRSGRFRRG